MRSPTPISILLLLVFGATPVAAQYNVLETDDLRLIYHDLRHGFIAPHAARCFENSMAFYRSVFDYTPSEKVTVILDDSSDYNNAGATSSPRNFLSVQISPPNTVYETTPGNEAVNHTMNHELGHVVALDQSEGPDNFFRGLFFGKVRETADHPETILYSYLTTPRRTAPRWFHEGVAVFLETWMAGGVGRAQGAYDEMVFRAMVRDGSRFYDPLGLESEGTKVDFQVGANSYLYGARFVCWAAYRWTPEHIVRWIGRKDGSAQSYSDQFVRVFGLSLDDAWQQWIEFEHEFQRANLESVQEHPITPVEDVSPHALGSVSRSHLDPESGTLYAAVNYPGKVAHITGISLADGSLRPLSDIKGPALHFVASLAFDPDSKTLFYSADNYEWRDLFAVDVVTGQARRLLKDARIGDLVFNRNDRSLWGVRHFNGIASVVRLPHPYTGWNRLHSFPYGQVIYDIDLSPDGGRLSFSLAEIDGRQSLHVASTDSLLAESLVAEELFDFGSALPANFVFTADGRHLAGSSYYTGVSNIWRYDFERAEMEVVSNTDIGLFRPLPVSEDEWLVYRYTGDGFVPARLVPTPLTDVSAITFLGAEIAAKHPVVTGWNVGSPARVDLEEVVTHRGLYQPMAEFGLTSLAPVVEGYKDHTAAGVSFNLSDPAYFTVVDGSVSWTPTAAVAEEERIHAKAKLRRGRWTLRGSWNRADFYDLFGPTKTSRKGYMGGIDYHRSLIHDRPTQLDLNISSSYFGKLERLPDAQNVAASFDRLWSSGVTLSFERKRRSIGSIDHDKGSQWSLELGNNHVNGRSFPNLTASLDGGVPLPLPNSSFWLRTAAGVSPGEREEPFANFFFGGFGNNWVDHRSANRYRLPHSFPGVGLNAVGGTNFVRVMGEWNLPPLRFRRVGVPTMYLTWARTSLFSAALVTNLDHEPSRSELLSLGGQTDVRFTLLSRLNMTFSVGFAYALEEGRRPRDEFMLSLKVL